MGNSVSKGNSASKGNSLNKVTYGLSYLVQGMFSAAMGTYLPVYLEDSLSIDPITLTIISFLAYFPLVLKPILAILGDSLPIKGYNRKYYVVIGTATFILITLLISTIPTEPYIILFTVLLSLAYLSLALFDANLDGLMVDNLIKSKSRVPTVVLFMIFLQAGSIAASFLFSVASGIGVINRYLFLFTGCAVFGVIVHILSYKLKEQPKLEPVSKSDNKTTSEDTDNSGDETQKESQTEFEAKPDTEAEASERNPNRSNIATPTFIVCSIVFALFLNGDKMSDWLLEPYITDAFTTPELDAFLVYSNYIALFAMVQIVGYLIALFLPKKNDPYSERSQKVLIVLLIIFGVQWILFPFLSLGGLILMTSIIVVFGGMAYIQFIDIFMMIAQNLKTQQKSTAYQVYLTLFTIGSVIARPLGTLLNNWLSAGTVIILCSIPMFISAAALFLIHREISTNRCS